MRQVGSQDWNNTMFVQHPTPYRGVAGFLERGRARLIAAIIRAHAATLPERPHLLEVGCESGHLLRHLRDRFPGFALTGIDISDVALRQARERLGEDVTLLRADVTRGVEGLDVGEVDVLVCSEVLEHIPNYDDAIRALRDLAGPRTVVIVTVPVEKYKNMAKRALRRVGLFSVLFDGIETGMSEWHVNDFSRADILGALAPHFDVRAYSVYAGLHQVIVAARRA